MSGELAKYIEIYGEPKHTEHAIIIVMFDRVEYLAKHLEKLSPEYYDIILVLGYRADLDYVKKEIAKYPHNIIVLKRKYDDGPAGGFYLGYRYALERGYLFMSFAEDDAYPTIQDLPIKIRIQGKMAVPNQLGVPEHLFRSAKRWGMWSYNTISRDVKISMCPMMYFYYEDAYALLSVSEDKKVYFDNIYVNHESHVKFHSNSPFFLNRYLLNRNTVFIRSKYLNLKNTPVVYLYILSILMDMIYYLFYDRKSIYPSLLGIVDGITRNFRRFFTDPKLRAFRTSIIHQRVDKLPDNIINTANYDLSKRRVELVLELLKDRRDILIYPSNFGYQTVIYRLLARNVYIDVEGKYYLISNSNISRAVFIISLPIIMLMSGIILVLMGISKFIPFECKHPSDLN